MRSDGLRTIGELCAKYNCSLRTLRFYDQIGLLNPHREGQHRFYNAREEIKLNLIIHGKRLGLSLEEIRRLILEKSQPAELNNYRPETTAALLPIDKIEYQINRLSEQRREIDVAIAELREAQARSLSKHDALSA